MTFEFTYPAGPFSRWSAKAAESIIGQEFDTKIGEVTVGRGKVLNAECIDGGRFLKMKIEWPREDSTIKRVFENNIRGLGMEFS